MRQYRNRSVNWVLMGCVCLGVGLAEAAQGSIVFGIGTINAPNNVMFPIGQQGLAFSALAVPSGDTLLFTQPYAPETLKVEAGGQGWVGSLDGNGFTSFRTQFNDGSLFESFELNAHFNTSGITFVARASDGTTAQFLAGNGQNRIHAYGTGGTLLESLEIVAPPNAIANIRQVRIGGAIQPAPAAMPEPSSWILLTGLLAVGLVIHARRRLWQPRVLAAGG